MNFLKKKNKLKPGWIFSQNGNLWRFIFGGENLIVGETRDLTKRVVYFFVIDISSGKTYLKNFLFEDGNYWISIEGATSEIVFFHRYDKPELPYHKNIIALDINTGEKLWENEKYLYLFNTTENLYGIKQNFESYEIVELNLKDGNVKSVIPAEEHSGIYEIRDSVEDLQHEFSDYPVKYESVKDENISSIINNETKDIEYKGDIEYLIKKNYLIFNYYVPAGIDLKDLNKKYYENRLRIFDIKTGEILYSDILNAKSTYNVPDNFFTKNNYLFYLREKKEIVFIELK